MGEVPEKIDSQKVDLSDYANKIHSTEDRPLFDEAVEAGKAGALRAAMIMIWLTCAESLKRRFREAKTRCGTAAKIYGEIEEKEREQRAIDKFILKKANDYGFVSTADHSILLNIYEMRCIYGHPYEEAPSQEQVSHAAAMVVKHVLSKPVKLRHGFGEQLLKSLLEEPSFLDDQQSAVEAFAKEILPRIDEKIHGWLLDRYWSELEKIADDPFMSVFFRRGKWFTRKMLLEADVAIFSNNDWHDKVIKFPKILMCVCGTPSVFKEIGERAQDSLVGLILTESGIRAKVLIHLELLYHSNELNNRQRERFIKHVSEFKIPELRSAGLSTQFCFEKLIEAMKSHDWYIQNPAIDFVVSNGPNQAVVLNEENQIILGRNILQCAQGNERSACTFLEELSKDGSSWPFSVLRGIALESYTNEDNQIRFKFVHIRRVLSALGHLKPKQQSQLFSEIAASVDVGTPKEGTDYDKFDKAAKRLEDFELAAPLTKSLKARAVALQHEREQE